MGLFRKINERSNLSMAVEASKGQPAVVDFFGNRRIIMDAEVFLHMKPSELLFYQATMRRQFNWQDGSPARPEAIDLSLEPRVIPDL